MKYLYKNVVIEYAGFKLDEYFCFYGYFKNKLLFLSASQIKQLTKI